MEHTRQGLIAGGMQVFAEEAHWFEFSELWDVPKQVREFGKDIAERGLLDLPYPKTVFWCSRKVGGRELALVCERIDATISVCGVANGVTQNEFSVNQGSRVLRIRLMVEHEDGSQLFPPFLICRATGDIAFAREDVAAAVSIQSSIAETLTDEDDAKWWRKPAKWICEIAGALLSRDVELIRVGPPERKVRRDKELGREPTIVYHVLSLKPSLKREIQRAIAAGAERRQPPRIHWRRGHFRDLSGGTKERLVPVAPSIVGAKERGILTKDYSIKAS